MKKKAAQQRNFKIMQLRGILPRLRYHKLTDFEHGGGLLFDEIIECLTLEEYKSFTNTVEKMLRRLDEIKKINFLCANCIYPQYVKYGALKRTSNKKAYCCDKCGKFGEPLYLNKDKRK